MSTSTPMGSALGANPNLEQWLAFHPTRREVIVQTGRVEFGQGILTALAQIAADELDVGIHRIRVVEATTASGPDEQFTAASWSVERGGEALRRACADARRRFVIAVARRRGIDPERLDVEDGVIIDGQQRLESYWDLLDAVLLTGPVDSTIGPKPADRRRVVGRSTPRLDLPAKLVGGAFIHDLVLDRMRHARVIRPSTMGARLVDAPEFLGDDFEIVRDGNFLAVVGDDEWRVAKAQVTLRGLARWVSPPPVGMPVEPISNWLQRQTIETSTIVAAPGIENDAQVHHATYSRPYLAHASIGPSCALAAYDGSNLTVWTHSQGIHPLRGQIAVALDLNVEVVTVRHVQGAGCYGHNGADDAAFDAALIAFRSPGRPIRVQWSREDELAWSPAGAAMTVELSARTGSDGLVEQWAIDVWSAPHARRPGWGQGVNLLGAEHMARAWTPGVPLEPPMPLGGAMRNAVPFYSFPSIGCTLHHAAKVPVRSSSLRSLGAFANVFAIEGFMDELAERAGMDPLDYRLRQLDDLRARAVLERAAALSDWRAEAVGEAAKGMAFARYKNLAAYVAVVVEIELGEDFVIRRVDTVVDAGQVINPDGLRNQIEGGAIQSLSWALKERLQFDEFGIATRSWDDYPILRFSEVPQIHVELIDHPGLPPLGVGEVIQGPMAGALGNAVYRATGVRIRDLPITRDRLIAAIA